MDFVLIGLILYIIHVLVLDIVLVIFSRKNKDYSPSSFWISELGEKRFSGYKWVNASITIFGILACFFAINFQKLLPNIIFTKISSLFLYLTCTATISSGLFPRDKYIHFHHASGLLLFTGMLGTSLFSIFPIYISNIVPNWIVVINLLILLLTPLLIFPFYFDVAGQKVPTAFKKIKGLGEWLICLLAISWNLSMSIVALSTLI